MGISQNVELMKKYYPSSWKSFIGEADATFWMGGNHPDNAALLSQIMGKVTKIKRDLRTGQKTTRDVDVMTLEQITRYLDPDSDRLIVTLAGGRALRLRNDPYFKALPVWKYAADPEYGDRFFRKMMRRILGK